MHVYDQKIKFIHIYRSMTLIKPILSNYMTKVPSLICKVLAYHQKNIKPGIFFSSRDEMLVPLHLVFLLDFYNSPTLLWLCLTQPWNILTHKEIKCMSLASLEQFH